MSSAIFKGYDSIFAKRLRSLIDEKGTTIQAVAENISDMSGTKITRQAVSQYADGTTMPNAERIYYIAQYFGVSADYLLGLSDVQSTNKGIQYICDCTGLSEKSVKNLYVIKTNKAIMRNSLINHLIESQSLLKTMNIYYNSFVFDEVTKNEYGLIPKKETVYSSKTHKKLSFAQLIETLPQDRSNYEKSLLDSVKKKIIFNFLKKVADVDECKLYLHGEMATDDYYPNEEDKQEVVELFDYEERDCEENYEQLAEAALIEHEKKICAIYNFLNSIEEGEQSGKHTED